MLICDKCTHEFSYKKILKKLMFDKTITCNNCGAEYTERFLSRFSFGLMITTPWLLLRLTSIYSNNFVNKTTIVIYLVWICILTVFYPLFSKWHLKE